MEIILKELPKSEVLLTITLSQEELEKYEEIAAKYVSQGVDIPGFRRGQAPKAFVISHLGAEAFFQEVLRVALPQSYYSAIKEKNVAAVSRPEVKLISRSPLQYEARVGLLPQITIKGYEKIKIQEEPIKITEDEIDEVITEMRKYRATFKPLERSVQKGDRVEIDFCGYDEAGAALDKTKSTNHPLFVGEKTLVEGFEEELVGMKQGEKKKFPIKFPKDFHHETLRGKHVHFEVEIKRAEEPILPEINEEFISQLMGQPKGIPEFRAAIKSDMEARKKAESRRSRENILLERLLKDAKLEIPPILIDEEIDYMIDELSQQLESRGLKFETYLEKLKKEKREIRKEYAAEAEKRVAVRLILNYLFRELKIGVADDEMKLAVTKLLERTEESEKPRVKENLEQKGELYARLKNNLMLEKLFVKFLD